MCDIPDFQSTNMMDEQCQERQETAGTWIDRFLFHNPGISRNDDEEGLLESGITCKQSYPAKQHDPNHLLHFRYDSIDNFSSKSQLQLRHDASPTLQNHFENSPYSQDMAYITKPSTLPSHSRPSSQKRANFGASFRRFLASAESLGFVKLHLAPSGSYETSVGVLKIIVIDVKKWQEKSAEWYFEESGATSSNSFTMRLRRLGFRPINRAPPPATSGFDYGLKRTDVEVHGFEFRSDIWYAYLASSSSRPCARKKKRVHSMPTSPVMQFGSTTEEKELDERERHREQWERGSDCGTNKDIKT